MTQIKRKRLKLEESEANQTTGTEVGFSVVVPIVGGTILGVFLDKKFNLTPKLTLFFLFLGVIIGFINIIKIVNQNEEK